jgi:hypothetical protein
MSKNNIFKLSTMTFIKISVLLKHMDPDQHSKYGSGSSNSTYCGSMQVRIRIRNPAI